MGINKTGHDSFAGAINCFPGLVPGLQFVRRAHSDNILPPDSDSPVFYQAAFLVHRDDSTPGKKVINSFSFAGHFKTPVPIGRYKK